MLHMQGSRMLGKELFGLKLELILPELFLTLIILLMCIFIYLKTRDLYTLTKHKGIKFFRNTFLYFGIAYLTRLLFSFRFLLQGFKGVMPLIHLILGIIFIYSSSMAILSLAASLFYKEIKNKTGAKWLSLNLHQITIILIGLLIIFQSSLIIFVAQILVSLISIIFILIKHKKIKITKLRLTYLILFLFWAINLLLIDPLSQLFKFRLLAYLFAVIIFGIITYKTIKHT